MDESPDSSTLDMSAVAERLGQVIEDSGVSATDFAKRLSTPYSTLRAYTSGSRLPSAEVLAAMFKVYKVMPSWVLTGDGPRSLDSAVASSWLEEFVVITRHDVAASAGPGAINGDGDQHGGLCFSRSWLRKRRLNPDNLIVINVTGQSMEGRLSDGDTVLVDQSQTVLKSGFAYVLRQGEELLVKYCQLLPDGVLRVSSENKSFEPYDIDLRKMTDVSILGRVVASNHEW